uniref:Uncharacterized protein n=5 Tax=Triticinae TaxID=1648030 RepID=A0A453CTK0_AEGTS
APATQNPQTFQAQNQNPTSLRSPLLPPLVSFLAAEGIVDRSMATMGVGGAVKMIIGAKEERVVATGKAPGACPSCGGPVVATDVESERRILCLPLCLKSKRKYYCTRCFRRLVTVYS